MKTKENTGNVTLLTCAQSAFMTTVFKPIKDSLKSKISEKWTCYQLRPSQIIGQYTYK